MNPIPLIDLAPSHRELGTEIESALRAVLADGRFVGGPAVAAFEAVWADFCGTRHAVGVANGTDALEIGLAALGIGPGDEVIAPAHTFAATAEAVHNVGARPVLADISPSTFCLDPAAAEAAITSRTAAIIAVHLYGHPADMTALGSIAARHGLALVEDAAQAHGAVWRGRRTGSIGQLGCFSFYPSKNLGAMGDAGAIVTDDDAVAARARAISHHGQYARDRHEVVGRSSRLDSLQAAVLAVKLPHLDAWNGARAELAARYAAALAGRPGIILPVVSGDTTTVSGDATHVYHLYVVRVPAVNKANGRDALAAHLAARGIDTRVHYPTPVHLQPPFVDCVAPDGAAVAERVAREVLSLPMYPQLPATDVDRVAAAIAEFAPDGGQA